MVPYAHTADKAQHGTSFRKDAGNVLLVVLSMSAHSCEAAIRELSEGQSPSHTNRYNCSGAHPSANCTQGIAIASVEVILHCRLLFAGV